MRLSPFRLYKLSLLPRRQRQFAVRASQAMRRDIQVVVGFVHVPLPSSVTSLLVRNCHRGLFLLHPTWETNPSRINTKHD